VDTKGIFAIQQLHLGHVAKSFGLLENPKTIRNHDDVLGKIANGQYGRAALAQLQESRSKKMSREERDQKYALGSQRERDNNNKQRGDRADGKQRGDRADGKHRRSSDRQAEAASASTKRKFADMSAASVVRASAPAAPAASGGEEQNDDGDNRKKRANVDPRTLQKMKKVGSDNKVLTASGKFRKSQGGYFRKKLREQHTSEFSH
jgi:hypothetical protein